MIEFSLPPLYMPFPAFPRLYTTNSACLYFATVHVEAICCCCLSAHPSTPRQSSMLNKSTSSRKHLTSSIDLILLSSSSVPPTRHHHSIPSSSFCLHPPSPCYSSSASSLTRTSFSSPTSILHLHISHVPGAPATAMHGSLQCPQFQHHSG